MALPPPVPVGSSPCTTQNFRRKFCDTCPSRKRQTAVTTVRFFLKQKTQVIHGPVAVDLFFKKVARHQNHFYAEN
jgi:hypothetical protein